MIDELDEEIGGIEKELGALRADHGYVPLLVPLMSQRGISRVWLPRLPHSLWSARSASRAARHRGVLLSAAVEIVLRTAASTGTRVSKSSLDRDVVIMRKRLVMFGDRGSVSRLAGSQRITVRLKGLSPSAARVQVASSSERARLGFYDLTPSDQDQQTSEASLRARR